MLTAYMTVVTVAFFVALAASVVGTVASLRA